VRLLIARTLWVSVKLVMSGALALITDYHRDRTRSLATGLHISGLYAGLAFGGIGGYFAECGDGDMVFSFSGYLVLFIL